MPLDPPMTTAVRPLRSSSTAALPPWQCLPPGAGSGRNHERGPTGGRRGAPRSAGPDSLHCDDVDRADVRVAREQVGADLSERGRDLPVEVGLPPVLALEGVEDAVDRVADLEGVPGRGAGLGD